MKQKVWMTVPLVLLLALVNWYCAPPVGKMNVGVLVRALSADTARVTVTVSGDGISSPITEDLSKNGEQWQGQIGNIPVGSDRTFHAEAYDADGDKIYESDMTGVTISEGSTASVLMVMQESETNSFSNNAPLIDGMVASSNAVALSGTVSLSVTAHDPDTGDTLTYAWTATGGSFDTASSTSPTWTAPATAGDYTLTVTVTDNHGASDSLAMSVSVQEGNASGEASVQIDFNARPQITQVTSSKGRLAPSETTELDVSASDPDGDSLSYSWSDGGGDCAGSFSNANAKNPTWTAPATAPAAGSCTLTVTVSDSRSGTQSGAITVVVASSLSANLAPVISSTFQSSSTASLGDEVTLRLTASDPEGGTLTFSWNAATGSLSTPTTSATTSEVTWTAPAAGGSQSVIATVQDSAGTQTSYTFTITCAGVTVSTFSGSGTKGYLDGDATTAQFSNPAHLAFDSNGNLYVADTNNSRIRKIDTAGNVTTFAGSGTKGYLDGDAATAQFDGPHGVAVDSNGNVYVADSFNNRIRKIDTAGNVTTFAGSGANGYQDGPAATASFMVPLSLAVDSNDNVYVADYYNHCIRKIDSSGNVTTFAGNGSRGYADGNGTTARFKYPYGLSSDGSGNLYVADYGNRRIRKIDASGNVTTVAGSGTSGYLDGDAATAQFKAPTGVVADSAGNVYVADHYDHRIRRIDSSGNVTTLAGTGSAGYLDGSGTTAQFNQPFGLALNAAGDLFLSDYNNNRIRKISF